MVRVQVCRVRSFDSGTTIVDQQKFLPALPRRTASRFRPVRMQDHHYRRPISLSPVPSDAKHFPALHFPASDTASPTAMTQPCQNEAEINSQLRFGTPPRAVLAAQASVAEHPMPVGSLPPSARAQPPLTQSPTLPQISDSYHEEDNIPSYYGMHEDPHYDPNRTAMVLQSMIDELKSQNSSLYSCSHRIGSSVYSLPRMQGSVYSVCTRSDGGWI